MVKHLWKEYQETIKNFFWRCAQVLGKQGIAFFIFILCSKILSLYDFGIYNYVLAILYFLVMFGDFGISTATSKYVAEYSLKDQEKLKVTLFNSSLMIAFLSVVITLLTLIFGHSYLKENYKYVLYILPLVFLAPMTSLYDGVYRGLKRFKALSIISTASGAVSIIIVYFLVRRYGLFGALLSQNIFYIILLTGLAIGYGEFHLKINKKVAYEIGKYSFSYGLALIGNYLFIRFGILILGRYGYIEQIGTYEVINKVFMLLLLPFSLLGQVIAPNFSLLASNKEYGEIYKRSKMYTVFFLIIGAALGGVLYYLLPLLFNHFMHDFYIKSYFYVTFVFSLITFIANVCAATFDAGILVPSGYAKLMATCYLGLGILGAGLSFYFVRIFGFVGVFASFAFCSVIMVILLRSLYFRSIYKCILDDSKLVL